MKKTPLTDKLKKYLSVIEKVTLPNTLNTGIDQSNFTKNWTQSGQDFDKFFGLDALKQKLGRKDFNEIDYTDASRPNSKAYKNAASNLAYNLFKSLHTRKIELLTTATSINPSTQESIYVWKSGIFETINEATLEGSPVNSTPQKDGTFWRSDSNLIFVKRAKYPDVLFANIPGGNFQAYIHRSNGTAASPPIGPAYTLNNHVVANFKPAVQAAIQQIRPLLKSQANQVWLDATDSVASFSDLPILIQDALLIGVLDAADTKVLKGDTSRPAGAQALMPNATTLNNLEVMIQNGGLLVGTEEKLTLPDNLLGLIRDELTKVLAHEGPYRDNTFLADLRESNDHKKYNITKAMSSTCTTLYFIVAQAFNSVLNTLGATPDSRVASKLIYGSGLGYGQPGKRSSDYIKEFHSASVGDGCPVTVIRAVNLINTPLRIESFIVNLAGDSFILPYKDKNGALSSAVHSHVSRKVGNVTDKAEKKKEYIKKFLDINVNMSAIQSADQGKEYWAEILNTCYDGEKFNAGVLFVGLSPLFWDTPSNGGDIYVFDDIDITNDDFAINVTAIQDGEVVETATEYTVNNAIQLWFEVPGSAEVKADGKIMTDSPQGHAIIQARNEKFFAKYADKCKTLAQVREEVLVKLYDDPNLTSQKDLANLVQNQVGNMLKNARAGFWAVSESKGAKPTQLAGFNPWQVSGSTKESRRFTADNTTVENMKNLRNAAMSQEVKKKRGA